MRAHGLRSVARRLLRDGAGLLLAAPLWGWWAVSDGAYPATVWLPGLLYLAAAVVVLIVSQPRPTPDRAAVASLGCFVGLTAWSACSIAWAGDPGAAWIGAERMALLSLAFALPLLWPPSPQALLVGLVLWIAASVAGIAGGLAATLSSPETFAEEGRLVEPTGYANATAALALMGAFPALVLAARPERAPLLRSVAFATSGALAGSVLLTQSRGAVAVAAVVLAVALLAAPSRVRLAALLGIGAVVVALMAEPLLAARGGARAGAPAEALVEAVYRLAGIAAGLGLLFVAYLWIERRARMARAAAARGRRAAPAVVAMLAAGAVVAFAVTVGDPIAWGQERLQDFRTADYERLEQSDTRFTGSLGSNRYEYWRVSLQLFSEHPLNGAGATNFAAPFLERRRVDTAPLYAHSIWFQTLADLGLVGAVLLAGFLIGATVAWRRAGRADRPPERALRLAAVLPLVYLGVHASADWVSFFPGLTAPALALAAAGLARSAAAGDAPVAASGGVGSSVAKAAAIVVLIAVAASAVPPYLAGRLTARAASTWTQRPAGALADLERAQELNLLSDVPALHEGIIATRLGQLRRARAAFAEAAERHRADWFAALMVGTLEAAAGNRRAASAWLARAQALNPREELVHEVRSAARRGLDIDPRTVLHDALKDA